MNFVDLVKLSPVELRQKLQDLRGQLFVLRFQIHSGKTNKFSEVKKLKGQIAHIETIFSQHRLGLIKTKNVKKIIPSPKKS
ncbi:MAG: 50S ribosomal protein L29 [Mollicutes bacterium]|nr:MAG: 50S ribosomal protein L29 [Mollicutes bacterium]